MIHMMEMIMLWRLMRVWLIKFNRIIRDILGILISKLKEETEEELKQLNPQSMKDVDCCLLAIMLRLITLQTLTLLQLEKRRGEEQEQKIFRLVQNILLKRIEVTSRRDIIIFIQLKFINNF